MEVAATHSLARVVVLAGQAQAVLPQSCQAVRVESPYEAAAEVLAAPALALVVDLRLLGKRHLRLLEIAQKAGAQVLAVGPIPAGLGADELSGVQLAGLKQLPQVLAQLCQARGAAPAAPHQAQPDPSQRPQEEATSRYVGEPTAAGRHAPIGVPQATSPQPPQEAPASARPAPAEQPPAPPEPPKVLNGLLSPEELAALLEDDA